MAIYSIILVLSSSIEPKTTCFIPR